MITGRVIGGRYVVLDELGRGGMGVVWRAEDRVIGRQVAVKELRLPEGLSPTEHSRFRERLLREARTAGRLNHPGIVTVHDVVADEGVDHIVMELIEARTLADVVDRDGPLDERSATEVARQVLAALRRAHTGGVVHRDVKPSNVMLGNEGRVTLTDFGIAQAADDPRLTTTGLLVGSPGYMAPERLEGAPAAPPADLWALGATLYHAVEGAGPFNRETTPQTIYAVMHDDPPPPRCTGRPLGAVIAGLLNRNPQTRLTAEQAEFMLTGPISTTGRFADNRTIVTTLPGTAAPAPATRRGIAASAVVVAVVALLVGLGPRRVGRRPALRRRRRDRGHDAHLRRRRRRGAVRVRLPDVSQRPAHAGARRHLGRVGELHRPTRPRALRGVHAVRQQREGRLPRARRPHPLRVRGLLAGLRLRPHHRDRQGRAQCHGARADPTRVRRLDRRSRSRRALGAVPARPYRRRPAHRDPDRPLLTAGVVQWRP